MNTEISLTNSIILLLYQQIFQRTTEEITGSNFIVILYINQYYKHLTTWFLKLVKGWGSTVSQELFKIQLYSCTVWLRFSIGAFRKPICTGEIFYQYFCYCTETFCNLLQMQSYVGSCCHSIATQQPTECADLHISLTKWGGGLHVFMYYFKEMTISQIRETLLQSCLHVCSFVYVYFMSCLSI